MEETGRESPLMSPTEKRRTLMLMSSNVHDELQAFRRWLKWLCVDQSNVWTACLSWFVFVAMTIFIPAFSHFVLACAYCDARHSRPDDAVAQLSLSGIAAISFVCLSHFISKYGLRRFLFFDKLRDESEIVRKGYTKQFNGSTHQHLLLLVHYDFPSAVQAQQFYLLQKPPPELIPQPPQVLEHPSPPSSQALIVEALVHLRSCCPALLLRARGGTYQNYGVLPGVRSVPAHLLPPNPPAPGLCAASQFSSLLMTTRPNADVNVCAVQFNDAASDTDDSGDEDDELDILPMYTALSLFRNGKPWDYDMRLHAR
ncbi:hypothetical protein SASPL_152643 [Salvia splendens]|uniref:Uncharacterized protein n=1 Tax=Salvia splendens TaxID=180675 RepID=A0A8X8W3R6_SALSN|nr:hypothetical protein SASPL_152643 [Salvia splendens]